MDPIASLGRPTFTARVLVAVLGKLEAQRKPEYTTQARKKRTPRIPITNTKVADKDDAQEQSSDEKEMDFPSFSTIAKATENT